MNIEPQGFCDTNIFVDFSLIDKFSDFIEKYKKLRIADAVHKELEDWNRENYEYSFIYDHLVEQINLNNIELIERKHFTDFEIQIIERRLEGIFEILNNLPEEKKKHLNEGEIISAVYAEVLEAPFIQTNDNFPRDLKYNEFKNILFLTRVDILQELCTSFKEVRHYEKLINSHRKKMDKSFEISKSVENSKLDVEDSMIKELLELKERISKG
ncbi:hypothetical protein K4R20_03785 [Staphylococcus epidermidis]|uniref:hypothetical protein n=1 Tax=Staphylococcus epidermidis TaxID=1282 RepID=UPI00285B05A6|nr:hypothetical protein [Staphylococcus epidermidis]MCG1061593.1 hypothetical protein [Staphylococcus epidermidis]MCG2096479.1 hypothetical protein [Staphylococcus epidermidis]MCG2217247.1 hypothetical protein [Staphylococcus epidermidis]MDR6745683.1 hypothetical protein [Staphylococcus epidermidis]